MEILGVFKALSLNNTWPFLEIILSHHTGSALVAGKLNVTYPKQAVPSEDEEANNDNLELPFEGETIREREYYSRMDAPLHREEMPVRM